MTDKELVLVAMMQNYVLELYRIHGRKASVAGLYQIIQVVFDRMEYKDVLRIQMMRNEIFQQVKDSYTDHTIMAQTVSIISRFYFDCQDVFDKLGKQGQMERYINSIINKLEKYGDASHAIEFVRRYRNATNKYFYDLVKNT